MNLVQLKESNQDFEWYPTTREMIQVIVKDIEKSNWYNVLDIGAGNGSFFKIAKDLGLRLNGKYAIEKSEMLIKEMDPDICIVGTDFEVNTLIDKKVDVIFCNPPYSRFDSWASKIILEANCSVIYMIIPERWKESDMISQAIKRRNIEVEIIGEMDFLDADVRKSRAKVNIIKIDLDPNRYSRGYRVRDELKPDPIDAFDLWFEDNFMPETEDKPEEDDSQRLHRRFYELVKGDHVSTLIELYRSDMDHLLDNYRAVCNLDREILRELGVNVASLKDAMKLKIKNLKTLYWNELFNKLKNITTRLTAKTREQMVSKFQSNLSVDFTRENILSVLIWAIKNVNSFYDSQLLELYQRMSSRENIQEYKSNFRFEADGWRYAEGGFFSKHNHYSLDYRIILQNHYAIYTGDQWSYDYTNGLSNSAHEYINDIFVIARNLGFNVNNDSRAMKWSSGKQNTFYYVKKNKLDIFAEIRAYKNGNIHVKLSQDFMKAYNIEAARLLKWIKSPKEAKKQMGISITVANKCFGKNFKVESLPMLLASSNEGGSYAENNC